MFVQYMAAPAILCHMPVIERPVLVAPDSFKGTFSAPQVAGAVGRGLERAGLMPPDLCPVADGGEGTLDALLTQLGGEIVAVEAQDPLGRPRRTGYAMVEDGGTAIVEMAMASGLGLVAEGERDAWAASTYGTGQLIAAAAEGGAKVILDALDFDDRMRASRAVVTGEGKLDEQTLEGKLVGEIGTRARQAGVPLHAIVGTDRLDPFGKRIIDLQLVQEATDLDAMEAARERLGRALAEGRARPLHLALRGRLPPLRR